MKVDLHCEAVADGFQGTWQMVDFLRNEEDRLASQLDCCDGPVGGIAF
jgi:hypothetical protein